MNLKFMLRHASEALGALATGIYFGNWKAASASYGITKGVYLGSKYVLIHNLGYKKSNSRTTSFVLAILAGMATLHYSQKLLIDPFRPDQKQWQDRFQWLHTLVKSTGLSFSLSIYLGVTTAAMITGGMVLRYIMNLSLKGILGTHPKGFD